MAAFNTQNKFLVGGGHNGARIMNPPREELTKEDALNLVAWVSTVARLEDAEIIAAIRCVEET